MDAVAQFKATVVLWHAGSSVLFTHSVLFLSNTNGPDLSLVLLKLHTLLVTWSRIIFMRFLLTLYQPGCMATLSAWYTREELSLRTAILYCGSLLAGAFSGLIAAGINDGMDGSVILPIISCEHELNVT